MQHLHSPSNDQTQAPQQCWCGILTTVLPGTALQKQFFFFLKGLRRASDAVQWLRISLTMQGMQLPSTVSDLDPTGHRAADSMHQN